MYGSSPRFRTLSPHLKKICQECPVLLKETFFTSYPADSQREACVELWGMLRNMIEYKLAECDGVFVEVPTVKVKPSQTCPNCGRQEPKTLDQREHHCAKCGYTDDRDVAASKVMLSWALGTSVLNRGEESSTVSPASKSCGGFRQLSSAKRQKLSTQRSG